MLGEMLYVPQSEIDITGGSMERPLNKEERQALTYSCQNLEIDSKNAPIQLNGDISYVEQ